MRIAVASGKGGTGKTTVATSLVLSLAAGQALEPPGSAPPLFLDCDVESPNGHIFLKPIFGERQEVGILIPLVDEEKCTHCGKCAEVCQYHAIASLGKKTLVFPQLCHGCGSCTLMCPEGAITETLQVIGIVERGITLQGIEFARGILNIGEPMAVPIIRQLKHRVIPKPDQVVIIDVSPGTSCPVVEAVRGADFLLLVTEPTPFGLHDLKLMVQVAGELGLPAGVVLNRCDDQSQGDGYSPEVEAYCREHGLPILLRIPFKREIAAGIAQGKSLVEIHPESIPLFQQVYIHITNRVSGAKHEAACHP